MRISKLAASAMLGIAALGLSACATALNTQVSRYQQMPAPQGQTFVVVPGPGPGMATHSGLEFQRYASIVAQQLAARGYRPATNPSTANMIVQLSYDVDRGTAHYELDPFTRSRLGAYGGPYGGSYGPFYYPRYGYRSPYYYGWNDPFWYGGNVDSYVEYHSQLDLHIRQAGTNTPLFDGRAQARSATNRLDVVIPSLVEAMFTNFPGRSGENIRITIPNRKA
jgi:hypothetical protein